MTRFAKYLEIVGFTEESLDVGVPRQVAFGEHYRRDVIDFNLGTCKFLFTGVAPVVLCQAARGRINFLAGFSLGKNEVFGGPLT